MAVKLCLTLVNVLREWCHLQETRPIASNQGRQRTVRTREAGPFPERSTEYCLLHKILTVASSAIVGNEAL